MNDRRKALKEQYKERKLIGGVYRIFNTKNERYYLKTTKDIQGSQNQFFSYRSSGICTNPSIMKEWSSYGAEAFEFEVLEIWEKDAIQSDQQFSDDLKTLFELWAEKLPQDKRY